MVLATAAPGKTVVATPAIGLNLEKASIVAIVASATTSAVANVDARLLASDPNNIHFECPSTSSKAPLELPNKAPSIFISEPKVGFKYCNSGECSV